jgi:hypothetical protein
LEHGPVFNTRNLNILKNKIIREAIMGSAIGYFSLRLLGNQIGERKDIIRKPAIDLKGNSYHYRGDYQKDKDHA